MATHLTLRTTLLPTISAPRSSIRCVSWSAKGKVARDVAATLDSKLRLSRSSAPAAKPDQFKIWRVPRGSKKPPKPPGVPNAPMSVDAARRASFRAIHEFFAREFPTFDYNRRKPFPEEFVRLHRHKGWPLLRTVFKHRVRDAAWRAYHTAVYEAFSDTFGRNTRSKFHWSLLAMKMGIEPDEDLEYMRRQILMKNFNIVDLMAALQRRDLRMEMPDPPEPCATEKELANYPIEKTVWYFPNMEDLHPNQGMLLYLLRGLEGRGKHRWAEKKKPQPVWEDRTQDEEGSRGPLDMLGTLTVI